MNGGGLFATTQGQGLSKARGPVEGVQSARSAGQSSLAQLLLREHAAGDFANSPFIRSHANDARLR